MQTEIAKQRDTEKYKISVMASTKPGHGLTLHNREFAGVLQYLVGPPVERGLASNLHELRITKTGYMMKRYYRIIASGQQSGANG